jgi:copper chaperone CopZ
VIVLLFSIVTSTAVNAQTNDQELNYVKVEVKGLACPFCAYGLEKKLKEVDGVKSIKIDFVEGLAYLAVLQSNKPTKETLERIITDSGFTVGNIEYSDKPFKIKETND